MEDKVTTNQFSQLRSRKLNDKKNSGTVTFWDAYLGIFEVQKLILMSSMYPLLFICKLPTQGKLYQLVRKLWVIKNFVALQVEYCMRRLVEFAPDCKKYKALQAEAMALIGKLDDAQMIAKYVWILFQGLHLVMESNIW